MQTVVLFFLIQVLLSLIITDPVLRLVSSILILFAKTKDIKTSLMVPVIYWGLAYVLKSLGVYETFDNNNSTPLHKARLAEAGQLTRDIQVTELERADDTEPPSIVVPAETRQTVLFSESDDPDRPDNIEENPRIPRIDPHSE